jgi:radical SAM protein with 4Fe4S-binding SPASM domain
MGIRPNGDMSPCPYLPVFGGNLRQDSFEDIWNKSDVFIQIRQREHLGGRCGNCEFGGVCGGCRARAYGITESFMNEDPLCDYTPGRFQSGEIEQVFASATQYGLKELFTQKKPQTPDATPEARSTIEWNSDASARMQKIPAFVRGTVIKRVEAYCRERQLTHVTLKELEELRARMPAKNIFS